MHCPNHPKYKGQNEIKRLEKCEGCRKVRQAWLVGFEKRKNRGKGSQFSITSPGFRCGIVHLMSEVGTVILYGKQPPFFWRKNVQADPRAKKHFSKIYNLLNFKFQKQPEFMRTINQVLWIIWENDFHNISREKEYKQSYNLKNEKAPQEESKKIEKHLSNVHINPLLYSDLIEEENGEEETEHRSF